MNLVAKPPNTLKGGSERRFELSAESAGMQYILSALLALGLHACLIFGWQGSPHFEPAEYGVVNGESAIEVALIAAPQHTPESVETREEIAPPEPADTEETAAAIVEPPEPEPAATPTEPVFNTVQDMPKPENSPQPSPEPTRAAVIATAKPRAVVARKDRPIARLPSGRSGSDSQAFRPTSGSRASKPAYLYNPHPPYPEAARKAGQTGVVMLRVSLNERGRVSAVSLIRSSGHSLLDDRARTAVQRWIFRPARLNGKPVATQVDVPVRFSLDR